MLYYYLDGFSSLAIQSATQSFMRETEPNWTEVYFSQSVSFSLAFSLPLIFSSEKE